MKFSPMNILTSDTWVLVSKDGQKIIGGERRDKKLRPVESDERIMYYKDKYVAQNTADYQHKRFHVIVAKVRVTIEELVQKELED